MSLFRPNDFAKSSCTLLVFCVPANTTTANTCSNAVARLVWTSPLEGLKFRKAQVTLAHSSGRMCHISEKNYSIWQTRKGPDHLGVYMKLLKNRKSLFIAFKQLFVRYFKPLTMLWAQFCTSHKFFVEIIIKFYTNYEVSNNFFFKKVD